MRLNSKLLGLERALTPRAGMPKWALREAERELKDLEYRRLHPDPYNSEEAAKVLNEYLKAEGKEPLPPSEPRPAPPPLSTAKTVEGYAADLVKRFKTKEGFCEWRQRQTAMAMEEFRSLFPEIFGEASVRESK